MEREKKKRKMALDSKGQVKKQAKENGRGERNGEKWKRGKRR